MIIGNLSGLELNLRWAKQSHLKWINRYPACASAKSWREIWGECPNAFRSLEAWYTTWQSHSNKKGQQQKEKVCFLFFHLNNVLTCERCPWKERPDTNKLIMWSRLKEPTSSSEELLWLVLLCGAKPTASVEASTDDAKTSFTLGIFNKMSAPPAHSRPPLCLSGSLWRYWAGPRWSSIGGWLHSASSLLLPH